MEEKSLRRNWPRVEMAQELSEDAHSGKRIMRKQTSINQGPDGLKSEHSVLICTRSSSLSHKKVLFHYPGRITNSNPRSSDLRPGPQPCTDTSLHMCGRNKPITPAQMFTGEIN